MDTRILGRLALAMASAALCLWPGGCGSTPDPGADDPLVILGDAGARGSARIAAIDAAKRDAEAGLISPVAYREALKRVLWSGGPSGLRVRAARELMRDPENEPDSRKFVRLAAPTEPDDAVVAVYAESAVDGGWDETLRAFVRAAERRGYALDDAQPLRLTLEALGGDRPLAESLFAVFVAPIDEAAAAHRVDWARKERAAAWALLERIDPDGAQRKSLAASWPSDRADAALLALLTDAAAALGVTAGTGESLRWLEDLYRGDDAGERWLAQTRAAVAQLSAPQRAGLALRHLEAVRWASVHRPELLKLSRDALAGDLLARFEGRRIYRRGADAPDGGLAPAYAFSDAASALSWGDLVAVLAVDESVRDPGAIDALFEQAGADRRDTTTEYGGLLFVADDAGHAGARARLFAPRAAQRVGDRRFVASPEMFAAARHALAHYHFHAQEERNADYAGPGDGDYVYADTYDVACVVVTSVGRDRLNADLYLPGRVTIDLGELRAPSGGSADAGDR